MASNQDKNVESNTNPNITTTAGGVNLVYEIEECTISESLKNHPPPDVLPDLPETPKNNENKLLEPDHPLLEKFQRALKEQLLQQLSKVKNEVNELENGIKKKSSERDSLGVRVYDAQQMITLQRDSLQRLETEIYKLIQERSEIEKELEVIKENHQKSHEKLFLTERKEIELRNELETLNFLLNKMLEWESKIQSDLNINKRIADKSKINRKQFTEEKRNLDFIIYKLMTDIFRLENNIEHIDMQLRVKEQEREKLGTAISNANADVEAIEQEHKRLIHCWNSVLIAIGQRDKTYFAAQKDLEKEKENLFEVVTEITTIKKLCNEEMQKNERLTLIKGRIDMDKVTITSRLSHEQDRLAHVERKLMETQSIITQTSKDLDEIITEKRVKLQILEEIRREVEKYQRIKSEIEERILLMLQQQMSNDKMSKYMYKTVRDLKEKNRNLEINLASFENKNAEITVQIEQQKAINEECVKELNELIEKLKIEEADLIKKRQELVALNTEINRNLSKFDIAQKKYEELLIKCGGVELSPVEMKIKNIEKQISEMDDKNAKLKSYWLRKQTYIVAMKEDRQKQIYEINIIKKQIMLLAQQNLRLEDELEALDRQEKIHEINMKNMKYKIDKINGSICSKRGLKEYLDVSSISFKLEYINRLKDAEMECIKLDSKLVEMEEEKDTLSKNIIEINREALAWERKIKLAMETKQTIANEKGSEGEIGTMKAEIHRMTVRLSQLRKAQEKLIVDLNHCVSRREFICINAEATEKRLAATGKYHNRFNFKKKIEDLKNKTKLAGNEAKQFEEKLKQAQDLENEFNDLLAENSRIIEVTKTKINELIANIEEAKISRQNELEVLVFKQHKLRAYTSIIKGQYRRHIKSDQNLEFDYTNQMEMNKNLQNVVEKLLSDFPALFREFTKMYNTAKVATENL